MDGEAPPPSLPPSFPTYMFPQQDQIAAEEIDWVTLFSGGSDVAQGGGSERRPPPAPPARDDPGGKDENNNDSNRVVRRVRKAIPPRIAFHTRSVDDVLDDGYKWRKYGQKSVKNSSHPRSYYRCTHHTCNVKKQIQRLSKDTSIVVTTYEGIHNHPCEKLMESLSPLLKQIQFLSRF